MKRCLLSAKRITRKTESKKEIKRISTRKSRKKAIKCCYVKSNNAGTWLIDSGASDHVINDKSLFMEGTMKRMEKPTEFETSGREKLESWITGSVKVYINKDFYIILHLVYFVKNASQNMFSIPRYKKEYPEISVVFHRDAVMVFNGEEVHIIG